MYIAQAEKDYQVPMKDFDIWKEKLGGKDNVTMKLYPDCYHLFIPTDEQPGKQNYEQEGHVAKALIDDIAGWIETH